MSLKFQFNFELISNEKPKTSLDTKSLNCTWNDFFWSYGKVGRGEFPKVTIDNQHPQWKVGGKKVRGKKVNSSYQTVERKHNFRQ